MPLLVPAPVPPPPPPRPVQPRALEVAWTAPNGEELGLTHVGPGAGIRLLAGAEGFGAAPRQVTTQALATGGTYPRWSSAGERLLALPLHFQAATTDELVDLRRMAARLFLATTPPASTPRPGRLRVTRGDGTWREIEAYYLDGLSWTDEWSFGPLMDRAVLQLLAPDPFWYGEIVVALDFGSAPGRSYLTRYETVSPDRTLGEVVVDVEGEVNADPVWTITGPADSTTIRYAASGPGITLGAIAAGGSLTVNVEDKTITDHTGANRVASVAWPTSTLFQLQPGANRLLVSISAGVDGQSGVHLTYRPRYETS